MTTTRKRKRKIQENEFHAKSYSLYRGDCCEVIQKIPDESVGISIFSPPFSSLYSYSDDHRDMSNSSSNEEFFTHFGFLIRELYRIIKEGRIVAVHCMDLPTYKRNGDEIGLYDFSGDVIRHFEKEGFIFHSRHAIWKDPLIAATRTKAIGLMHKQLTKDSSMSRMGLPDYMLAFRKKGENKEPIEHKIGLTEYHGSKKIPREFLAGENKEDQSKNKKSHWIWRRYASPVWDDIRQTKTLRYTTAKDKDDVRHICPLQLDVIERSLQLWSNEGDTMLTPFMGVGSEVFCAVRQKRRAIGIELKPSYFRQAKRNLLELQST